MQTIYNLMMHVQTVRSPMDGSTVPNEDDDGNADHSNDDKPGQVSRQDNTSIHTDINSTLTQMYTHTLLNTSSST